MHRFRAESIRTCGARIVFVALIAALIGCDADGPGQFGPSEIDRPNVVILVLDTFRADALSSFATGKPLTPMLDQLASAGATFPNAFATDYWTLPTHASILTGRYPSEHGADSATMMLPEDSKTLATALSAAGYRTAAFVSNSWLSVDRGFDQGFRVYREMWNQISGKDSFYRDSAAVDRALSWVDHSDAPDAPFFLFMNFMTTHLPYTPHRMKLLELDPEFMPIKRTRRLKKISQTWDQLAGAVVLDDSDFEIMRRLYAGEVAMLDELIGRFVEGLSEKGLLESTVLIVTADHGEEIGERGHLEHRYNLHDEVTRIPLILRFPARVPAGLVENELVSQIDIYPTVLDAVGVGLEGYRGPGRSLIRSNRSELEFVVAENENQDRGIRTLNQRHPSYDASWLEGRVRMLRTDQYKLIWWSKRSPQLFDLVADPGETNDVAAERPEEVARLMVLLEKWDATQDRPASSDAFQTTDPQALEELRALGYIE